MLFDIFCRVIDNHGDVGVCWRLCRELAERGHRVRLWIDEPSALGWLAPGGHPAVEVVAWCACSAWPGPGDVVIEAFGCELPEAFVDAMAADRPAWINFEYLSAETYVERNHGLRSPVRAGLDKFFFYPGFSDKTGGLLREHDLTARQAAFERGPWLRSLGIALSDERLVSLFCYEPPALSALLRQLASASRRTRLLVTAGRAAAAVQAACANLDAAQAGWNGANRLQITALPLLSQRDFDTLLWSCDFNFVRGEDSLVRALWAGKPFAWQLYPQRDGAHEEKLEAFLRWLAPPAEWREFFRAWNGVDGALLPSFEPDAWRAPAEAARSRALALPELATRLLAFVDRGRI